MQELQNKIYQMYCAAAGKLFGFDVTFILVSVVAVVSL